MNRAEKRSRETLAGEDPADLFVNSVREFTGIVKFSAIQLSNPIKNVIFTPDIQAECTGVLLRDFTLKSCH